jgi:hypothetical protein
VQTVKKLNLEDDLQGHSGKKARTGIPVEPAKQQGSEKGQSQMQVICISRCSPFRIDLRANCVTR